MEAIDFAKNYFLEIMAPKSKKLPLSLSSKRNRLETISEEGETLLDYSQESSPEEINNGEAIDEGGAGYTFKMSSAAISEGGIRRLAESKAVGGLVPKDGSTPGSSIEDRLGSRLAPKASASKWARFLERRQGAGKAAAAAISKTRSAPPQMGNSHFRANVFKEPAVASRSKPPMKVKKDEDEVMEELNMDQLGKFEVALKALKERVANEAREPSLGVSKSTVQLIKKLKSGSCHLERMFKMGRWREWVKDAEKDNALMLAGKLTAENAAYKYEDKRFYGFKVSEHAFKVLHSGGATRNVALIQRAIEELNYCDKNLAYDILAGFQTLGVYRETSVWPEDEKFSGPVEQEITDFFVEIEKSKKDIEPSWMPNEIITSVFEQLEEDVKLGRVRKVAAEDIKAPAHLAFGVPQKGKIRQIVDERFKNLFNAMPEKMKLRGLRSISEVISMFCADLGKEGDAIAVPSSQSVKDLHKRIEGEIERKKGDKVKESKVKKAQVMKVCKKLVNEVKNLLQNKNKRMEGTGFLPSMSTKDWKKFYHQLAVDSASNNVIKAWNPKHKRFEFYESFVLNMGNRHSVPSACRVSEFFMFIMEWLCIVAIIYIDDTTLFSEPSEIEKVTQIFTEVSTQVGVVLSDKPASNRISGIDDKLDILGLDFVFLPKEKPVEIRIEIPDEKIVKTQLQITVMIEEIENKCLTLKTVQKTVGACNYIACSRSDRAGAQLLRPLYPLLNEFLLGKLVKNRNVRRSVLSSLRALAVIFRFNAPIIKSKQRVNKKVAFLLTDASKGEGEDGRPELGAVLFTADGDVFYTSSFSVGNFDINFYEAQAVEMAVATFRDLIKDMNLHILVDNTNVCYGLIKASHNNPHVASVMTNVIVELRKLEATFFVDYIRTSANLADWLTRKELRVIFESLKGAQRRNPLFLESNFAWLNKEAVPKQFAAAMKEK